MRCSVILVKVEIMMCKVKNILKDIYSVKSKLFYLIYLGSSSAWSKCSLPEFRKVRTYWPWTPVLPLIWPQNPIWYDFPTGEEEKFSFGWFNKRSKIVTHYRIFFIISKRFIYFYYYFSFCWRAPGTPLCTPVSPQVPLLTLTIAKLLCCLNELQLFLIKHPRTVLSNDEGYNGTGYK